MNPLDQLADIAMPQEVSAWPPAMGYWIALVLIVITITSIIVFVYQRNIKRRPLKQSIDALKSISQDDPKAMLRTHQVLKTAVQRYFPEQDILQIKSDKWRELLTALYPKSGDDDTCQLLATLSRWQYDQRIQLAPFAQVQEAANKWLSSALPPSRVGVTKLEQQLQSSRQGVLNV